MIDLAINWMILAQANRVDLWVILLLFYFFLIHFGMIFWLISGIVSMARKDLGITHSFLKLTCAVIGALAVSPILWEFLTKFNDSADARESGYGLLFANLPAAWITGLFYEESPQSGLSVYIVIFYPLFGFIGGWGIGQFLEWISRKLRWEGSRA